MPLSSGKLGQWMVGGGGSYKDGIIFIDDDIAGTLSGAMSHISGCIGSKYIVAFNKDKEANIFSCESPDLTLQTLSSLVTSS
jgi:hypothetical protein